MQKLNVLTIAHRFECCDPMLCQFLLERTLKTALASVHPFDCGTMRLAQDTTSTAAHWCLAQHEGVFEIASSTAPAPASPRVLRRTAFAPANERICGNE
jgi:hypothetical protein